MKDEEVSTLGLDSQDWEFVAEMVADTENAATHFMQAAHHLDIKEPAQSLEDSLKQMEDTMEKLKLRTTATGVETHSLPEGVDSVMASGTMGAASRPPPCPRVRLPSVLLWMPLRWNQHNINGRSLAGEPTPSACGCPLQHGAGV